MTTITSIEGPDQRDPFDDNYLYRRPLVLAGASPGHMNFVHLVVGLISDKATLYWNTNPWKGRAAMGLILVMLMRSKALSWVKIRNIVFSIFFQLYMVPGPYPSISWVKKQKKVGCFPHQKKKKKTTDQSMNSIPPPK